MAARTETNRNALRISLSLLTQSTDGSTQVTVPLPVEELFQSLSLEQVDGVGFKGTLTLFDPWSGVLDDLFLSIGSQRFIRIKWDWQENYDNTGGQETPVYDAAIVKALPAYAAEGVTYTIELTSVELYNSFVSRTVLSFAQGSRFSSFTRDANGKYGILQQVAEAFGWSATPDNVIETTGTFPESRILQQDEPVINFLKRLAAESVSADDAALILQIRAGIISLVTRYKGVNGARKPVQRYQFRYDAMGTVISFAPVDGSMFNAVYGGGNCQFVGTDSKSATRDESKSTVEGGVQGRKNAVPEDAQYTPNLGTTVHNQIFLVGRDREHIRRLAAQRYSSLRDQMYRATLGILGSHDVNRSDLIDVILLRPKLVARSTNLNPFTAVASDSFEEHYLSGTFFVESLTHEVSTSGWTVEMQLSKRGAQQADGSLKTANTEIIKSQQPEEDDDGFESRSVTV